MRTGRNRDSRRQGGDQPPEEIALLRTVRSGRGQPERLAVGFTLAECMIAVVLLAVVVVAVSQAVVSGQAELHDAISMQRAMRLAEDMQERIAALPYCDPGGVMVPGPEANGSEAPQFNNADDFDGYTELPGQLRDIGGNLYPGDYQAFTREVSAEYQTQTVPGLGSPIGGLMVTVTVMDHRGRPWSVSRFLPAGLDVLGSG